MKPKFILAALAALPLFALTPATAHAGHGGGCREYTKTIRIGGQLELGIGQACPRYDGMWEIVSLQGPYEIQDTLRTDIYDALRYEGMDVLVVNNYYGRPQYHYNPPPRYYRPPVFRIVYNDYDDDRGGHGHRHHHKKHHHKHHRHHDHDRGHDRGHDGRGHDRHDDDGHRGRHGRGDRD